MEHNTDRSGDLEMEDDGPYQPQGELGVSICYVIISDVNQLDLRRQKQAKNENTVKFLVWVGFSETSERLGWMRPTCRCLRKSSAICTFCSLWNRIRPFSLG